MHNNQSKFHNFIESHVYCATKMKMWLLIYVYFEYFWLNELQFFFFFFFWTENYVWQKPCMNHMCVTVYSNTTSIMKNLGVCDMQKAEVKPCRHFTDWGNMQFSLQGTDHKCYKKKKITVNPLNWNPLMNLDLPPCLLPLLSIS